VTHPNAPPSGWNKAMTKRRPGVPQKPEPVPYSKLMVKCGVAPNVTIANCGHDGFLVASFNQVVK
jgi:hypothetical protein